MNEHVLKRIKSIRKILSASYEGGDGLPSTMIGNEREAFISSLIESCFPSRLRVSAGAIVGLDGSETVLSGQEDIIIEHPFNPSFPLNPLSSQRLVLAENVILVIEVKSNIGTALTGAKETVRKTKEIARKIRPNISDASEDLKDLYGIDFYAAEVNDFYHDFKIPVLIVSFTGTREEDTLARYNTELGCDGILIIETGDFHINGKIYKGDEGFFHFLNCVTLLMHFLVNCRPALGLYGSLSD